MYRSYTTIKGDPLCPLGFHPQVRWPSRCKRCFRDYKDHENRNKNNNGELIKSNSLDSTKEKHLNWAKNRTHSLDYTNENDDNIQVNLKPTSWTSTPNLGLLNDNTKANDVPTVVFTLPIKRTQSSTDFNTNVTLIPRFSKNKRNHEREKIANRSSVSRETLKKYRHDNEELKQQFEELQKKYERVEKEKNDILLKHITSIDSTSSKKYSNEILINLQSNCTEFQAKIKELLKIKSNLEEKIVKLEEKLQCDNDNDELRSKLVATESLCDELMDENEDIKKEIKDLEYELEEIQDSFCDDLHSNEFAILKKDLEQSNKNCRILSFKLRKSEKKLDSVENEKKDLEEKLHIIDDAKSILLQSQRINELEEQLNLSNQLVIQLQNDLQVLNSKLLENENNSELNVHKNPKIHQLDSLRRMSSEGIKVSRESLIRSNSQEDPIQLYRDLQDSIEREFDFKEQLKFSEEESQSLRKKLTRLEDENESLMLQLKKMCTKSHKKSVTTIVNGSADQYSNHTSDENTAELNVLLDLNEQECSSLRKKVSEYEVEIEILRNKIKEFDIKLNKKLKNKRKLFDQDINNNELSDIEPRKMKMKFLTKSRSLDTDQQTIDLKCHLKVVEQEVSVLRSKLQSLESENEKLINERNKYQSICNRKKNKSKSINSESFDQMKLQLEETNQKFNDLNNEYEQLKKDQIDQTNKFIKVQNEKQQIENRLKLLKENSKSFLVNRVPKIANDFTSKSQLRKMVENLENEISEFMVILKNTDEKCVTLQKELNVIKNSNAYLNYNKVCEELNDCKIEFKKLEKELLDKQNEFESDKNNFSIEKSRFDKIEEEFNQLRKESNQLKIENFNLNENIVQYQLTIKQLEVKIDTYNKHEMELNTLKEELNSLRTFKNEKFSILEEVSEKNKQISNYEILIKEIHEKLNRNEKFLKSKKDEIQELQLQIRKIEGEKNAIKKTYGFCNQKIIELENVVQQKNNQIEQLEKAVENESEKYVKNKDDNESKQYQQMCDELQIQLNQAEDKLNESKQKYENDCLKHKSEFDQLCVKYDKLENDYLLLKSKENRCFDQETKLLKEQLKNFEKIEKERSYLQLEKEQKDVEITQLKNKINICNYEVKRLKNDNELLIKKIDEFNKLINAQNRDQSKNLVVFQEENQQLVNKLNDLEQSKNGLIQEVKEKYESQLSLTNNEIKLLENQVIRLQKERNNFKETAVDLIQRTNLDGECILKSDQNEVYQVKMKSLLDQISNLEKDLSESNKELSNIQMTLLNERNIHELRILELKSKLNELEEQRILTSGRTKLVGLKTRLELAWQRERNEKNKLLEETTTLARDLRQTLFEMERERDKEKFESKRKLDQLKKMTDEEIHENHKKIQNLQQMIIELRDSQAKIRTCNEKLKLDLSSSCRCSYDSNLNDNQIGSIQNSNTFKNLIEKIDLIDKLFNCCIPQIHNYNHCQPESSTIPIVPKRRKNLHSKESSPFADNQSQRITNLIKDVSRDLRDILNQFESKLESKQWNRPKLDKKSLSLDQNSNHMFIGNNDPCYFSIQSLDRKHLIHNKNSSLNSSNDSDLTASRLSNDSIQSEIICKKKKSLMGRIKKLTKSKSVDHGDFKIVNFLNEGIDLKDKLSNMFKKSSKTSMQKVSSKNSEIVS